MTPADRLLLLLARGTVSAEIADRARAAVVAGVAWPRLLEQARRHGVAPLVARSAEVVWPGGIPGVPAEIALALGNARRLNAARSALAARVLARALGALAAAGVPAMPLKGVALSMSLHGDAALRVSSDVDLLVPRAAVARAVAAFAGLGWAPAPEEPPVSAGDLELLLSSNIEYAFIPSELPGCPVELHWDIAWRWPRGRAALADLWAEARPQRVLGLDAWAPSPAWEVLFLALHGARHRWQALKWLVDVHEICGRGGLDWRAVADKARAFGLTEPLGITLGACRDLLGTAIPDGAPVRPVPRGLALFPAPPAAIDLWRGALYPARLFRGPGAKLGYLARVLFSPTLAERRLVRLPDGLAGLHYALRPLRLAGRWGRDAAREWLDRSARSGRSSAGGHPLAHSLSDTQPPGQERV